MSRSPVAPFLARSLAAVSLCLVAARCGSSSEDASSGAAGGKAAQACTDLGACCAALADVTTREQCNAQLVSASSSADPAGSCAQLLVPYAQLCGGAGGADGGTSGKACDDLAACCASMSIESVKTSCLQTIEAYKSSPQAQTACADALAAFQKQRACEPTVVPDGGAGTGGTGPGGAGGGGAGGSSGGAGAGMGGAGGQTVPGSWKCDPKFYAEGKGPQSYCDCGCGAHDPDCDLGLPQAPTGCFPGWVCDGDGCKNPNAPPPGWTCPPADYAQWKSGFIFVARCDCGCGAHDPDCDVTGLPMGGKCKPWDTCQNDQCVAGQCHTDACNWPAECCSGFCSNHHCDTQACRKRDAACQQSWQCCHGSCLSSKCWCLHSGTCQDGSECCSGTCTKQSGQTSGKCKCQQAGDYCDDNSDCCGNLCFPEHPGLHATCH